MDFPTLPYLYVTISFHLEICFWGQTHPTISDDVTNFTFFFFEGFPKCSANVLVSQVYKICLNPLYSQFRIHTSAWMVVKS